MPPGILPIFNGQINKAALAAACKSNTFGGHLSVLVNSWNQLSLWTSFVIRGFFSNLHQELIQD